ncbi:MAG: hypothetical protein RLZ33_446 [Bacteroidota bacterium]|jgi:hypothetical protein
MLKNYLAFLNFKTIIMYDLNDLYEVLAAYLVVLLLIAVYAVIVMWKVFTKAGQPGWAILIPFYNLYVYTQVVQRPNWWMILYFASIIPILGPIAVLVVSIMDSLRLAKVFGKSTGFGIGLIFLGIIFQSILAFGDAKYIRLDGTSQGSGSNDLLDN